MAGAKKIQGQTEPGMTRITSRITDHDFLAQAQRLPPDKLHEFGIGIVCGRQTALHLCERIETEHHASEW